MLGIAEERPAPSGQHDRCGRCYQQAGESFPHSSCYSEELDRIYMTAVGTSMSQSCHRHSPPNTSAVAVGAPCQQGKSAIIPRGFAHAVAGQRRRRKEFLGGDASGFHLTIYVGSDDGGIVDLVW